MKTNFLLLILIVISTVTFGQNGDKNFIDQNYIEVIGHSEMEISPDEIYISILINEKDIKGKTLSEIEELMYSKLEEIGIDVSKNVVIRDFVSNFRYYWLIKSDILLSKEYELMVHDGKTAGKVFVELQKVGISNISINKLNNSKIEEYRKKIRINAIKSAKEQAEAMAIALNQNIGRAIFIQELEDNLNMTGKLQGKVAGIKIRGYSSKNYGYRAPDADVDFDKIKLEYNVLVRFELK